MAVSENRTMSGFEALEIFIWLKKPSGQDGNKWTDDEWQESPVHVAGWVIRGKRPLDSAWDKKERQRVLLPNPLHIYFQKLRPSKGEPAFVWVSVSVLTNDPRHFPPFGMGFQFGGGRERMRPVFHSFALFNEAVDFSRVHRYTEVPSNLGLN